MTRMVGSFFHSACGDASHGWERRESGDYSQAMMAKSEWAYYIDSGKPRKQ